MLHVCIPWAEAPQVPPESGWFDLTIVQKLSFFLDYADSIPGLSAFYKEAYSLPPELDRNQLSPLGLFFLVLCFFLSVICHWSELEKPATSDNLKGPPLVEA